MEEMPVNESHIEESKAIEVGLEVNTLDKSDITMEDNNKAQRQSKKKEEQKSVSISSKINQPQTSKIPSEKLSLIQNEKVFELKMDEFNNDTSFDTLTSDQLFLTCTEDHFPVGQAPTHRILQRPSKQHQEEFNHCEDSIIESELKKINNNLNTFTVEHFNILR